MPDPVVTLRAGGLALTSWDALTIERNIDSMADAFSFTCPSSPEIRAKIKPRSYTQTTVEIDGQPVLTGRVEKVGGSTSSASLTMEGRSLPGVLVDVSIGAPNQHGGLTLGTLSRQLAAPYGLVVSTPQGDSKSLGDPVVSSPGDNVADFLMGLARDMGWLFTSSQLGALELLKANPNQPPVAVIVDGQGACLDVASSFDGTGVFSEYTVEHNLGVFENQKATAYDRSLPVFRPTIRDGSSGKPSEIQQAANWDRALALADAFTVSVTLSSWTNDAGLLFDPSQVVSIEAPSAYIERASLFLIAGVTFSLTATEGRRAVLRCVLPATYTGEMPGVWPWD